MGTIEILLLFILWNSMFRYRPPSTRTIKKRHRAYQHSSSRLTQRIGWLADFHSWMQQTDKNFRRCKDYMSTHAIENASAGEIHEEDFVVIFIFGLTNSITKTRQKVHSRQKFWSTEQSKSTVLTKIRKPTLESEGIDSRKNVTRFYRRTNSINQFIWHWIEFRPNFEQFQFHIFRSEKRFKH